LGVSSVQSLQSQTPPHSKNRIPLNRLEACSRTTNKDHCSSVGAGDMVPRFVFAIATFGIVFAITVTVIFAVVTTVRHVPGARAGASAAGVG
jgi:hypothetical protein